MLASFISWGVVYFTTIALARSTSLFNNIPVQDSVALSDVLMIFKLPNGNFTSVYIPSDESISGPEHLISDLSCGAEADSTEFFYAEDKSTATPCNDRLVTRMDSWLEDTPHCCSASGVDGWATGALFGGGSEVQPPQIWKSVRCGLATNSPGYACY